MNKPALSDCYQDGSYAATHPTWHSERSAWKADNICQLLDRQKIRPTSALDIGCGAGQCLMYVANKYDIMKTSMGIEPSPDVDPQFPPDTIRFQRCTIDQVTEHFDLAMMLDVFEHVEDYMGTLRVTRSKANWFGFHIPLDIYAMRVLAGRMTTSRRQHGHLHYFSKETAIATLEDTGYEVVDWKFTNAAFEGPNRNPNSPRNLFRRLMSSISMSFTSRLMGGFSLAVLAKPK